MTGGQNVRCLTNELLGEISKCKICQKTSREERQRNIDQLAK